MPLYPTIQELHANVDAGSDSHRKTHLHADPDPQPYAVRLHSAFDNANTNPDGRRGKHGHSDADENHYANFLRQ